MKRLFLTFALLLAMSGSMNAQQVYYELRQKAKAIVNAPSSNATQKRINQFKLDALDYLVIKMREEMPDSTVTFLDSQAFALNNFVLYYLQTLVENDNQPAAFKEKLIKIFMDASISNPLFYDSDKELVLSYFADGNNLTRFSLDTDWRRAILAAHAGLKRLK